MAIVKKFASEEYVNSAVPTTLSQLEWDIETINEDCLPENVVKTDDITDLISHASNTSNPHSVTISQLGLSTELGLLL